MLQLQHFFRTLISGLKQRLISAWAGKSSISSTASSTRPLIRGIVAAEAEGIVFVPVECSLNN